MMEFITACRSGDEGRVRSLLEKGAYVDSTGDRYDDQATALMLASAHGHENVVKILINHGADIDARDYHKKTALMNASHNNNGNIVRLLLQKGAKTELRNRFKETVLINASRYGKEEMVELLLKHGALFSQCALLHACSKDYMKIVKLLLEHSKNDKERKRDWTEAFVNSINNGKVAIAELFLQYGISVDECYDKRYSPLVAATVNGMAQVVITLLKRGVPVNDKDSSWISKSRTVLMRACENGQKEIAAVLLLYGADVHAQDDAGMTSMMISCVNGQHPELIELLLKYRADVLAIDNVGKSAIMYASQYGKKSIVETLLKAGAKVNDHCEEGKFPLLYASQCINDNKDVIEYLVKAGAEVNAQSKQGVSALLCACANRNENCAHSLLEAGAEVNVLPNNGKSALMYACQNGKENVVHSLLRAGADVNAQCMEGKTALLCAIPTKNVKIVQSLIEASADVNVFTKEGESAVIMAVFSNCPSTLRMLLAAGANGDIINNKGQTAFTHAMKRDEPECLRILLRDGRLVNQQGILKSVHRDALCPADTNLASLLVTIEFGLFEWKWCRCTPTISFGNVFTFYPRFESNTTYCALPYNKIKKLALDAFKAGFCPGKINHEDKNISILVLCFLENDTDTLSIFLKYHYYFPEDYKFLISPSDITSCITNKTLLETLTCKLLSLETWSFLEVSKRISLSGPPGLRGQRVDSLPIPDLLKRRLKFENY